jgi:protein OS-9
MRSILFSILIPPLALASLLHSLPDDLYAFPKYSVTFLNGLPVLNETAERWLREGLRGGEAEFLDHPTPWREPSPFRHIDAGDGTPVGLLLSSIVTPTLPTQSRPHLNLSQIMLLR